jgi:hypothetical protein
MADAADTLDSEMSPWRPFSRSVLDSAGQCSFCPLPGPLWIWQRAIFRMLLLAERFGCPRRPLAMWPSLLGYYLLSLALEFIFQMGDVFSKRTGVWLIALIVLAGPPLILLKYPDQYTPMVETLLNALLFGLALYLGRLDATVAATKQANAKWLPQAASACSRLLTVWASIRTYRSELASTCANARRDLPELEDSNLKAVKTMLSSHCNYGSARLNDAANHLEDALEDWQRFIGANCEGSECARIERQIDNRRDELKKQFPQLPTACDQLPSAPEA